MNIGYVLGMEYVPERTKYYVNTALFFTDAASEWLLGILYRYASKRWEMMALIGATMTVISLFALFFGLPDSPKFYYAKKKYDRAREILTYIQRFNGVAESRDTIRFDLETSELEPDNPILSMRKDQQGTFRTIVK